VPKISPYWVHSCTDELEYARTLKNDITFWQRVFDYDLFKEKLENSAPSARLTLPGDFNHRDINFGPNYVGFTLKFDGHFLFETRLYNGKELVKVTIPGLGTRYFQNLIVQRKGENYELQFDRGNRSKLSEKVIADLKEPRLGRANGEFFLRFPLTYSVELNEAALQIGKAYKEEPTGGPTPLPDNTKTLSADLGINCFWAYRVSEFRNNQRISSSNHIIGGVRDNSFLQKLNSLSNKVYNLKPLIDYLKHLEKGQEITTVKKKKFLKITTFWNLNFDLTAADLRSFIKNKLAEINNEYKQLKRYDIYSLRQTGLCLEQFRWIQLTKNIQSLKKKWTYYGQPPVEKFATRDGFEVASKYLRNLKLDFVKKFAQSLIYAAREHEVKVVAIEDLVFDRSSVRNKKQDNELLAMWSPAMIVDWVKHFAMQYGIEVVLVNADLSSQYKDARPIFRNPKNHTEAFFINNGTLEKTHADSLAAENIENRLLHRSKEQYRIKTNFVANPEIVGMQRCYIPIITKPSKWKKTLQSHHFYEKYETEFVVINGDTGAVTPLEKKQFKKLERIEKDICLYRYEDSWITSDVRKSYVKEIEDLFERLSAVENPMIARKKKKLTT